MRSLDAVALADRIAGSSGILRWLYRRCEEGVTILMYHKILPERAIADYPLRSLVVPQSLFGEQMAWLAEHFEVVTVRDAKDSLETAKRPGRRAKPLACVTFDDGYRDNFRYAAPALEACGLRGTFFVTTGFVEGQPLWFDQVTLAWQQNPAEAVRRASDAAPAFREAFARASSFDEWWSALTQLPADARVRVVATLIVAMPESEDVCGAMTPDELLELSRRGHEIGAHSATHQLLTTLDDASLRTELARSRSLLRDWTGGDVDGVCYPGGDYDDRVILAAQAAGYRYGCGVDRGLANSRSNRMALPRRAILTSARRKMSLAMFESEVVGWHDFLRRLRTRVGSAKEYYR